ncbi:MAG: methyltransferase type 11 [Anaerolineales bacterium]|nr:methyltransferase type 11 [Anaerolineales bacterium]
MKLNSLELALMNNPVRAASQWWIESPLLISPRGSFAGKRVLEVGCGRGVGIEILLALGAAHVTGFDLDPKMVALAQKRVAKYGDRARVFVGDAEAIDAPDATFDATVDYGIIHHIPNWPQALKEIARVLRSPDPALGKPGGVFYFEDLLKGLVSAWLVRDLFDHPQATQFYGREFRAGLEAAGLHVQKWRQWGEWGIMGQAGKQTALEKINA